MFKQCCSKANAFPKQLELQFFYNMTTAVLAIGYNRMESETDDYKEDTHLLIISI